MKNSHSSFFMQKFIAIAGILFAQSMLSAHMIFAAPSVSGNDQYDLTSPDFKINPADLNPIIPESSQAVSGMDAFKVILKNLSDILLMTIPLLAGAALIIAGYFYIFSSGDSERISKGKTIIKWNLIAILVAFLSLSIVKIVASFVS